jgi:phenylacetate-CoA ligase
MIVWILKEAEPLPLRPGQRALRSGLLAQELGQDGRQMVRFHGIFIDLPHVLEGRLIQEAPDRFTVKVIGPDGFGPVEEASIRKWFAERLGTVLVAVHRVHEISRSAWGKFRAVVRNF